MGWSPGPRHGSVPLPRDHCAALVTEPGAKKILVNPPYVAGSACPGCQRATAPTVTAQCELSTSGWFGSGNGAAVAAALLMRSTTVSSIARTSVVPPLGPT